MVLAGDIGGTHARLAIFAIEDGRLAEVASRVYPSREYSSLEDIVKEFLSAHRQPVEHACFGIAGPVRKGRCETINLAWVVTSERLAHEIGLSTTGLINDLEANAYGLAALGHDDLEVLNEGMPGAGGNAAVIAAGTGLGEAVLYWDGKRHRPFATEGGHADFAPRDKTQVELLEYLQGRFGHASWERVVSGAGLHNIYEFMRDTGRGEEPAWLAEQIAQGDAPAVICEAGLNAKSPLCVRTLDLFVALYGAEAGNLALKTMATAGVYIGGGIAPKIVGQLRQPAFIEAFRSKGRIRPVLEAIPVRVILNDKTALLGAARCAALTASTI